MSKRPKTCDLRRLDLFLRNRLPQDFCKDVEAHLDVCPACRHHLDELAGGNRWWTQIRHHLGRTNDGPPSRTNDPTPTTPYASVNLSFLAPSEHESSLGKLGAYEILDVIGQGGMGIVLKAFDPALHRPVAIKVLAAEYSAHGAARKRFAREAQAVAAVIHDHVVPVHAVDADASPPFLVMSYIQGRSLQQRLDQTGPLALKEILRIGMQTASGLAAAHAQGLVHRDIKPANIMLENGVERVRITDFGLARAVDDVSVTQRGAVAGTPQYMSPEQARGEPVDQRADLFSLGSTMYAMCTGNAPFRGDSSLAVIRQVCDHIPGSVRSNNAEIPAWLEGIIRKLLAKNPAERFQSAGEVADLLERCLAHVQQPEIRGLPKEAEELGRQIAGPMTRNRSGVLKYAQTVAIGLAIVGVACFLLWIVFGKSPRESTEGYLADPNDVAPFFDEAIDQHTRDLQNRTNALQQSLSGTVGSSTQEVLPSSDLRRRTDSMTQALHQSYEPIPTVFDDQLKLIRHRLELLQQDLNRFPE